MPVSTGVDEVTSGPPTAVQGKDARSFRSILFLDPDMPLANDAPACFRDLNLDQIVQAITAKRTGYELDAFFFTPLHRLDAIAYRQAVMRDMEAPPVMQAILSFSESMRTMHKRMEQAAQFHDKYEKERWFLEAVALYCNACEALREALGATTLNADGFKGFLAYLVAYLASDAFKKLQSETRKLQKAFDDVRYCVLIDGDKVTVHPYDGEADYSTTVEATFSKFRHEQLRDYRSKFKELTGMNHIEAMILDRVALLNPELFAELDHYCESHAGYLDATIARFEHEIQFYVAHLMYVDVFRQVGLSLCYPVVSDTDKAIGVQDTFDAALAHNRVTEAAPMVCNDFELSGDERIFVVSGPNQGGKTTFARTFGQLHYMASLGCQVPGRGARLFLCDQLFTHYEREEDITNLRGKLEDDLVRIHDILMRATPNSIVVINEIFSSTALQDAVYLGKKVMAALSDLDVLAVCVTFMDELASYNEKTVSMVSMVDPQDLAKRTYKVTRRPADGLAYALAIAEKYRVTYKGLKERIAS